MSIAPSKGLVVIRMGNPNTTGGEVPFTLCNLIWQKLNDVMCYPSNTYVFNGNGNWNVTDNWLNKLMPPPYLPAGTNVLIDPVPGGKCYLNVQQYIAPTANITVKTGADFVVMGNLIIF